MEDGYPGIVLRSIPLTAWENLVTVVKWVSRGKSFALDADPNIAPCYPDASARRALGALHEAGLLDAPGSTTVDDTDLTEADVDRMMAAGTPVQIDTAPMSEAADEALKTRWLKEHGNPHAAHHVTELKPYPPEEPPHA